MADIYFRFTELSRAISYFRNDAGGPDIGGRCPGWADGGLSRTKTVPRLLFRGPRSLPVKW